MKSRTLFLAALLLNVVTLVVGQDIYGPGPGQQGQDIPKEQIEAGGTIKGIRNGQFYVVTSDGGQWIVNVDPKAQKLTFAGSADASWLQPGMFVEFNATVNAKGEATTPVKIANVMTPTKDNPPGVGNDSGGKSEDFFGVKEGDDKKKEETIKVRVVGQITGVKDGVATVNGGNAMLLVPFDPAAKISVEMPGADGLGLARPGDKIEFSGWYVKNNKGQAWANTIHVSGSEAFTSKSPAKPPKTRPMKEKPGADKAEKPADEKAKE